MPIYHYSGTNAQGQTERGMMPARSEDAVRTRLQSKGIQIKELSLAQDGGDPLTEGSVGQMFNKSGEGAAHQNSSAAGKGVPLFHLAFFFRQLASMLNAGIGPSQALATLSGQTQSPKLSEVLKATRIAVDSGQPLSSRFQDFPEVFTPLMVSMIRAGEEGGFLTEQCSRLSDYIQRDIELRNMIRRETMYPKVVIVGSIVIILASNWIIEAIKPGAQGLASPLTQASTWFIITPILVFLFIYFQLVKKNAQAKYHWDSISLKVPFIGNLVHGFSMAKFGRSFGALYGSGVAMHKAVTLSADACGNECVRAQIYPAADALETGSGITEAFARTGAFSPMVLDMTQTGEMTGNIDEMLNKVAEYYEEEGATKARQSAVILSVCCLLIVGVYVGYVYITNMAKIMGGGVQDNL